MGFLCCGCLFAPTWMDSLLYINTFVAKFKQSSNVWIHCTRTSHKSSMPRRKHQSCICFLGNFHTGLFLEVWCLAKVACLDFCHSCCYEGVLARFVSLVSTISCISVLCFICYAFCREIIWVYQTVYTWWFQGISYQNNSQWLYGSWIFQQRLESSDQWAVQAFTQLGIISSYFKNILKTVLFGTSYFNVLQALGMSPVISVYSIIWNNVMLGLSGIKNSIISYTSYLLQ